MHHQVRIRDGVMNLCDTVQGKHLRCRRLGKLICTMTCANGNKGAHQHPSAQQNPSLQQDLSATARLIKHPRHLSHPLHQPTLFQENPNNPTPLNGYAASMSKVNNSLGDLNVISIRCWRLHVFCKENRPS